MSHADDLALVTACRGWVETFKDPASVIALAVLSLIEDILKRHVWQERDGVRHWCNYCGRWQCVSRKDALAALHTIATVLGVATSTEIIETDRWGL